MHEPRYMRLGAMGVLALAFAGGGLPALAQERVQDRDQTHGQERDQEFVYGSQLMTRQERSQYQNRMHTLKTEQEREAYRLEHHRLMQQRARERGLQLPDEPPMMPGHMMGRGAGTGGSGRPGR